MNIFRITTLLLLAAISGCQTTAPEVGSDRIVLPDSTAEVEEIVAVVTTENIVPGKASQPPSSEKTTAAITPPIPDDNKPTQKIRTETETAINAKQLDDKKAVTTLPKPVPAQSPKPEPPTTNKPTKPEVAQRQNSVVAPPKFASMSGRVSLVDAENNPISAEGTFVMLVAKDKAKSTATTGSTSANKQSHAIDMKDKKYSPERLIIDRKDSLEFINSDGIRHNVFSSSEKNAFDLGTYGPNLKRRVTLHESGIVKVYCNIHADMATFIAVNDPKLTVITDASGSFKFENIDAGQYELVAWNIRGDSSFDVQLVANENSIKDITVRASNNAVKEHKNKFGKAYSNNLFNDEFY